MGIKTTKVWLLAAVCLLPWSAASLCPQGKQYWSNDSESCVNCSRCDNTAKRVVIRPCQAHADTVCGPISDLDIDWSWLKRDDKHKHHEKHLIDNVDDVFTFEKKHHNKKGHKHHSILDDDNVRNPQHHGVLEDEVETFPAVTHHGGHKHHKHNPMKIIDDDGLDSKKRPSKSHHIPSESFLSDDFESLKHQQKSHKVPPPPLKSTDDLEKEWKEWLIQSKNKLQHRKDDLLKNLHKESPYNEKHHLNHKLNRPSGNVFDDFDGEIFHHSAHHKEHSKKHFTPLDLEIFDRLLSHEHQKHEEPLSLSHLLIPETRHSDLLDVMKSEDKKRDEKIRDSIGGNDLTYPMDSFDFRSVVPTHRLFLGEPSTISEIMDQDLSEESEDDEDERLKEDKVHWQSGGDPSVVAVPFTATERLVWDWQAVALASAVAACLLFFTVVAVYSILHARQWRRLKTNFDTDAEELSVNVGLMQSHSGSVGSSAADAANTNHYLEKLLENKKKSSNIYTQKRPLS